MFKKKINNYYSYWQAIGLSFFSPNIYVDAAKRWGGVGAFYLLLLSFILAAPIAFQFIQNTRHYFAEWVEPSVAVMPTLVIYKGKLSMTEKDSKGTEKEISVWIWPPEQTAEQKNPSMLINLPRDVDSFKSIFIPILITQNIVRIQAFSPWNQTIVTDKFEISKQQDGVLGTKELTQMMNQIKLNLIGSAYPYLAWFFWITFLPSLIFFSFIAHLVSYALLRIKLPWRQSSRILCLAVTPSLIILEIFYLTHQLTQYRLFFLLGLALVYYLFGVRACQTDREL